jgi:hypothetical protein
MDSKRYLKGREGDLPTIVGDEKYWRIVVSPTEEFPIAWICGGHSAEGLQSVSEAELEGVDCEGIRLLVHQGGLPPRDATEGDHQLYLGACAKPRLRESRYRHFCKFVGSIV